LKSRSGIPKLAAAVAAPLRKELLVEVDVVPLDGDEVGVAEECREHEEWDQSFLIFCRAARLKEGVCHGVHLVERQGFLRPGGARAVAFGEFPNL
ncbi:hypothetical protein CLOM_g3175, partial [Closterium sp. NIES-68]